MDISAVFRLFKKEKIVTIVLLTTWLSCSIPTAHRRLKAWKAYTSYNHNGRYYTLPEIAKFDDNGLWRYRGVFFSKYGNLKQTLVHLVIRSVKGLSGSELGELLGLQPRSFLSHFRNHPVLCRKKMMGRWIWFSVDPIIRNTQRHARLAEGVTQAPRMPSDLEAVMILVDLIHHPNSGLEQIAHRLKPKQFFRYLKRQGRKRSGNHALTKTLKTMFAQTPLVKNLDNPQYMEIILNGKATLAERFAEVDIDQVRKLFAEEQKVTQKYPKRMAQVFKITHLPRRLGMILPKKAFSS